MRTAFWFFGVLFTLAPTLTQSAEHCEAQAALARIIEVQGSVTLNDAPAIRETYLCAGDVLKATERSQVTLRLLTSNTLARVDQYSSLQLKAPSPEKKKHSLLDLFEGDLYLFSRDPHALEVDTPFVNLFTEGTEFLVRAEADRTVVSVYEGRVKAVNDQGQLRANSGQSLSATADTAPQLITVVRPRDAVQWALYYQPILNALVDASSPAAASLPPSVRGAISRGQISDAFKALDRMPESARNEQYYVALAGLLLSVGRVEQANAAIEQAFKLNPNSSDGLALQAITAVTQNDKANGFKLAHSAVQHDPQSATARLALSYAQQAHFDLPSALESMQTAVQHHPDNALAWARLAELQLAMGELKQALKTAQKAVAISPDLAHTQTVLGFAHLTQIKTAAAKQAFSRAIERDQSAPLARLGLGLAKIREGELKAGREDLEAAVALDPDNSLYRSYMGKAYFEEKRDELAASQYEMAKNLDPNDPTPWLYEALMKQLQNRPVEALTDLQRSIELNDNRAVFRSQLLLDEDEATRGANLGRIYEDLGFEQLALNEGSRSLTTDPANHSAHRLLANTYANMPRHEIARDSELLQSQLLQPVNINPVQPRLGDSGLAFLDDLSLGDIGFSDYSQLFTTNQWRLQADGIVGGNGIWGDNLVLSGIHDNISYSLGQFHFETDGFRENNDQTQDIYNGFVQVNLSPQTSVQAEARWVEKETGDPTLKFFPENVLRTFRTDFTSRSIRLGFRHNFSPNSILLGSYMYGEQDSDAIGLSTPDSSLSIDDNAHLFETRYLHEADQFNITGGLGYYNSDFKKVTIFPTFGINDATQTDNNHANGYIYGTMHLLEKAQLILGISADSIELDTLERNQFNPKLGLIWDITPNTTFRAATFRVLKRPVISSQTLEPTQIAGFNQFSDYRNGTNAKSFGIAIDHKLSSNLFIGAELLKHDITVPFFSVADMSQKEKLGRAYLYWTPLDQLAVSATYQYERFVRDDPQGNSSLADSTTHKIPLEVRFFHPYGLFSRGRITYTKQEGHFSNGMGTVLPGKDSFSVVDAAIGYRLPNRLGSISLEARNLFDESFNFQDSDPDDFTIARERLILVRFTLAL